MDPTGLKVFAEQDFLTTWIMRQRKLLAPMVTRVLILGNTHIAYKKNLFHDLISCLLKLLILISLSYFMIVLNLLDHKMRANLFSKTFFLLPHIHSS